MEKYMETDLRYLKSLANQYPTVAAAATEIINLQAILSLPKGTEHFITDIHGEYDQFQHVIRNGSGAIKRKIEEEFGNAISAGEKKAIATLIYYPEQKLEQVLKTEENMEDWYKVSLYRLIRICKSASSKYTRSKVRKALPKDFAYVIEELLTGRPDVSDQEAYYNEIIRSVIRTGRAPELVIAFCNLIRRLVVDHLQVVGDIFDRGPYQNLIMDTASFRGYSVGEPRYILDGSGGGKQTLHLQRDPYLCQVRQSEPFRGRIRHQSGAARQTCHEQIRQGSLHLL